MNNNNQSKIPAWVFESAVHDCKDVVEFANKYRIPERFTQGGIDYVNAVMKSHFEDLEVKGFTHISKHDSVTGKLISFIPPYPGGQEDAKQIPKIPMNGNYTSVYAALYSRYNSLSSEIDAAICFAAARLLKQSRKRSIRIDLGEDQILVGEYQALISGYSSLKSILLRKGEVLMQLELEDKFSPISDYAALSQEDKLAILNVIESEIKPEN